MKSVSVIKDNSGQYSIHYVVDNSNRKLISEIDTIIYRGQCRYYGIKANIPEGFVFNIELASDCLVTMLNIPKHAVDRIATEVADKLGVMLNVTQYAYA